MGEQRTRNPWVRPHGDPPAGVGERAHRRPTVLDWCSAALVWAGTGRRGGTTGQRRSRRDTPRTCPHRRPRRLATCLRAEQPRRLAGKERPLPGRQISRAPGARHPARRARRHRRPAGSRSALPVCRHSPAARSRRRAGVPPVISWPNIAAMGLAVLYSSAPGRSPLGGSCRPCGPGYLHARPRPAIEPGEDRNRCLDAPECSARRCATHACPWPHRSVFGVIAAGRGGLGAAGGSRSGQGEAGRSRR
jgi:hypothetical protein